ncbi:Required for respiratory growth protein 9, mitochondrial [Pseudocercospora fuligena]|uniref:Required for respiratory growth protein 9, mitochondrial n=1 Tax=Pseudocercospora fuligena TaxID=685502 RepID=A0A8H6RLV8_9PEZI|nr:Required for respiratory growth protein 9, mitochondrial [Pseudocercospora fuligena]
MSHCTCATTALEAFVKEFAGLKLRQQRAQTFFQACRSFSTRPVLRRPETSSVAEAHGNGSADTKDSVVEATPTPRTKAQSRMLRKLKRIEEGKFAASASQRSRHSNAFRSSTQAHLSVNGAQDDTAAVLEKNDQQSQETESQVENVIEKIDQLEGPSIVKQEAKRKQRLVEKFAEKRKRRQRDKAKELLEEAQKKKQEEKEKKLQLIKSNERWKVEKHALQKKFGETGWQPRKRLSPDSLEGIRALHASDPATYTTAVLAANFEVSPESIRRVLKSKWKPSEEQRAARMERWEKRGVKKWEDMAKQGMKPPKKWRVMGVSKPKVVTKKSWQDTRQEPIPATQKKGKRATAEDDRDWRKQLRNAESSQDIMNLAERIM